MFNDLDKVGKFKPQRGEKKEGKKFEWMLCFIWCQKKLNKPAYAPNLILNENN